MPTITLKIRDLQKRLRSVQSLIKPLRPSNKRGHVIPVACIFYPSSDKRQRIIATHDGRTNVGHYREWYFRTNTPKIWGQYFEEWIIRDRDKVILLKAYLQITEESRVGAQKEIICVHCDPEENCDEPLRSFKKGPHLHVSRAAKPLDESHFPLNYGHLTEVLRNDMSLTKALKHAVKIIQHEVLEKL